MAAVLEADVIAFIKRVKESISASWLESDLWQNSSSMLLTMTRGMLQTQKKDFARWPSASTAPRSVTLWRLPRWEIGSPELVVLTPRRAPGTANLSLRCELMTRLHLGTSAEATTGLMQHMTFQ